MSSDSWCLQKEQLQPLNSYLIFLKFNFVAILLGISDTVIVQIVSREIKAAAYIGKMDSSRRPILR
jgi:hypothetical protein